MYGDSNTLLSTRITYVNVNIGRQFVCILIGPNAILITKCVGCNETQGCCISPYTWLNRSQLDRFVRHLALIASMMAGSFQMN